jgi:DNA-directed RNA polymerase subunit RPC12/RpoP
MGNVYKCEKCFNEVYPEKLSETLYKYECPACLHSENLSIVKEANNA